MSDPQNSHGHTFVFPFVKQSSVSKHIILFRSTGKLTLIFVVVVWHLRLTAFRWVPIKGNDWYWIRHHIKPGMKVYVEILVNDLHFILQVMFQRYLDAIIWDKGILDTVILVIKVYLSCTFSSTKVHFWHCPPPPKVMPLCLTYVEQPAWLVYAS